MAALFPLPEEGRKQTDEERDEQGQGPKGKGGKGNEPNPFVGSQPHRAGVASAIGNGEENAVGRHEGQGIKGRSDDNRQEEGEEGGKGEVGLPAAEHEEEAGGCPLPPCLVPGFKDWP